jgi:hypothetical protein
MLLHTMARSGSGMDLGHASQERSAAHPARGDRDKRDFSRNAIRAALS